MDSNFERHTSSAMKEESEEPMTPIEPDEDMDNSNIRQSEGSPNVSAELENPEIKDKKQQKKRKK